MKKSVFLYVALLAVFAAHGADDFNYGKAAEAVVGTLPQVHLLHKVPSPVLSAQAWTNYLDSLDFDRTHFRQEDVDAFEPHRLKFVEELQAGDETFASEAYNVYKARVAEHLAYAEELLKTPFDFTVEETYRWKRKKEFWPATPEEQKEIWRKRIKNEMLGLLVNKELEEKKSEEGKKSEEIKKGEEIEKIEEVKEVEKVGEVEGRESDVEILLKRHRSFKTMIDDSDREYYLSRWINALTAVYDPHTDWMSPASQEDFNINMNISLTGIGALLRSKDGTAEISELIAGGPAERDTREFRLVPGDRIIAVAQGDEPAVDILHWPLYKAIRLIRGPKDTKVVLTVIPASDPSGSATKTVDLIRDEVKLEEQAASSSVETVTDANGKERKLGVVRLPTFYSSTDGSRQRSCSADVRTLLLELNSNNVEGVILDLRSNGGGALKEAVDLAGLFLRTGNIVLVKESNKIHPLADYAPEIACAKPLIVMIDRLSASASEIVAAALRDYGRAVIVGDSQSHGKGTVQQLLPLGRNNAQGTLKVTNASFFRVNGSSTQEKGVESDIVLPSAFDFFPDLGEDKLPNAIPWSQVPAYGYTPVSDISSFVPELKRRSEVRLTDNERWQKYFKRIKRLESINAMEELPLELEQRRAYAATEKELDDLQDEIDGIGGGDPTEPATKDAAASVEGGDETNPLPSPAMTRKEKLAAKRAKDVVLDETLLILVDLIDTQGPISSLQSNTPSSMTDIFNFLFK